MGKAHVRHSDNYEKLSESTKEYDSVCEQIYTLTAQNMKMREALEKIADPDDSGIENYKEIAYKTLLGLVKK